MQFFQFLIVEVPYVSKEVMMWLVGLIFLVFLFYRSTATSTAKEIREKLKQKGCIPELYTFSRFQQVNAVYAKMMLPTFKNGFAQFSTQQSIMYILPWRSVVTVGTVMHGRPNTRLFSLGKPV